METYMCVDHGPTLFDIAQVRINKDIKRIIFALFLHIWILLGITTWYYLEASAIVHTKYRSLVENPLIGFLYSRVSEKLNAATIFPNYQLCPGPG